MADVEDRVFEREFDITPHELYTLLLDPAEHAFMCTATGAYTIGETSCSGLGLEGQSFTHWAGAVAGTYTETQRDTKIAMEWRWAAGGAAWADALPDGRDAISMTWTFEPVEGSDGRRTHWYCPSRLCRGLFSIERPACFSQPWIFIPVYCFAIS